jgi:glycosyltransferase involved in cell wall biosynthesis
MVLHNGLTPAFFSIFPRWSDRVLRRASALVAPSGFLPRALKPFGWDVRAIPNPIDLSIYPFRSRQFASPKLLWMRSFYPYYNPQMAVRTLTHLKKTYPDLSLVMAGKDKGLQATVAQLAVELGVAANITFPGFLDETAKIAQFAQADIFINTNNVDNAPVSIVEAWAMGVPVISTSVGGISDLVKDGETGLLVPDDDDQAMAQAVDRLLQSPDLAKKLSTNGREQAEKFTWDIVRRQWETLFAEITARN